MDQKASVGRIVHFQQRMGADPLAAIITAVDPKKETVSLAVYYPTRVRFESGIKFSKDAPATAGMWNWPPRTA